MINKFEEEICKIELTEWIKNMEIFVSYASAHHRVSSVEVLWRMKSITEDTSHIKEGIVCDQGFITPISLLLG